MYGEPTVKGRKSGLNSEGKEIGTQINNLEKKEEIHIQLEQNEETRIQKKKMRRGLGTSGTALNIPTPISQGSQKKRKSKKSKTYLNK